MPPVLYVAPDPHTHADMQHARAPLQATAVVAGGGTQDEYSSIRPYTAPRNHFPLYHCDSLVLSPQSIWGDLDAYTGELWEEKPRKQPPSLVA